MWGTFSKRKGEQSTGSSLSSGESSSHLGTSEEAALIPGLCSEQPCVVFREHSLKSLALCHKSVSPSSLEAARKSRAHLKPNWDDRD